MTEIIAYSKATGGRAYHYRTNENLTPEQIDQELAEMFVDRNKHDIVINAR